MHIAKAAIEILKVSDMLRKGHGDHPPLMINPWPRRRLRRRCVRSISAPIGFDKFGQHATKNRGPIFWGETPLPNRTHQGGPEPRSTMPNTPALPLPQLYRP